MTQRVGFAEFVDARSPSLMRSAFLLTGDWHLAEDLLQTSLMRCYGHWARIDHPEAYVRRAMARQLVGWRRRRWLGEVPTESVPEAISPADAEDDQVALRTDVLRLLRRLGPRQRAVLVLRFYEDMTEAQVADVLGVSVGTVKSQTARALERLRASTELWARTEELR